MKGIGGNIKADFQVFKSTTNEIGEAVKAVSYTHLTLPTKA